MFIKLKQAVCLNGKDFKVGVHDLSDKDLADPYFEKLVNAGLAIMTEKPVEKSDALSVQQATKEKLEKQKLLEETKKAQEAETSDFVPPVESSKQEAQEESFSSQGKHTKNKKGK